MKHRIDEVMVERGLVFSRSQAQRLIKLGKVKMDGRLVNKAHQPVQAGSKIEITEESYVSRAGFKLASVSDRLGIDFSGKVVLDVGSSTGGFTEYALMHGAKKVYAVDVGTDQLHHSLLGDKRIELHEKTDIRDFPRRLNDVEVVLIDVSFISLRKVLPAVKELVTNKNAQVVAMLKPQFETGEKSKNKGVVKNDTMRRKILKDFEVWVKNDFVILDKADSEVAGTKGNLERFYLLKPTS